MYDEVLLSLGRNTGTVPQQLIGTIIILTIVESVIHQRSIYNNSWKHIGTIIIPPKSFCNLLQPSQVTNKEFGSLQQSVQNCQQGCMEKMAPQMQAIRSGLAATPNEEEQKSMQLEVR